MFSHHVYKTYGELLRWHDKGFAIWEPLRTDEIKIGNVGYFDYHGGWQRVFDDIRDTLHPKPFDKEITIRSIKEEPECKFPSEGVEIVNVKAGMALEYKLSNSFH